MTLATHGAIGAIIVTQMPNHPVLGFCLAFISHFLLDAIPHYDYSLASLTHNPSDPMETRVRFNRAFLFDMTKVGGDFLIGCIAALILFWNTSSLILILAGVAGGVVPDFLQFLYFKIQREPLVILERLHVWIHTKNRMKTMPIFSFVSQFILVAIIYFFTR